MKLLKLAATVCAALAGLVSATSKFSPARPPSIPLAVRNPWMSTWLQAGKDGGNGGNLPGEGQVTGWTGLIKVDGLNYIWMGAPNEPAALVSQMSFTYTATRSIFVMNVDDVVTMTIEFLSPVLPNDIKRSSLAASYMNVQVQSRDGRPHDVQIYTDVSGEWVSGNRNDVMQWAYGVVPAATGSKTSIEDIEEREVEAKATKAYKTFGTKTAFSPNKPAVTTSATYTPYKWVEGNYLTYAPDAKSNKTTTTKTTKTHKPKPTQPGLAYHQFFRQSQQVFGVASDQAIWGNWYYSTDNTANMTYQQAADAIVRGAFIANGSLANTQDTNYRAINDQYPCFAFSNDLGMVTKPVNTLFTIQFQQEDVILYENGYTNSNQSLAGQWTNYFQGDIDAVSFFYNDYATAGKLTTAVDKQIKSDLVKAGGQDYYTIASLAVRQAFGALQLAANGTGDDYYVFLKEISSDGNVNTVDVIFPLHPILLYLNPVWLKWLLEPLLVNQESGYWPYAYSIHDLGNTYPVATGHNDGNDESQPLEECGNMVIMALAYAQRANDNAWLSQHYAILRQWNEYLIEEALIPMNQISTDDFAGSLANQTNLALKGIVGIAAMAEIANRTGNVVDGMNYTNIALSYITQWQQLGIAYDATPPHTTLGYGLNNTYGLLYNLFFDRELNLGLVPQSVYDMQSTFYPTVAGYYGVALDTRHTYTKLDWEMLCAAIANQDTRTMFFEKLSYWINNTPTQYALTDLYDINSGDYPGFDFIARPVVGALFGLLALESAPGTPALGNGS